MVPPLVLVPEEIPEEEIEIVLPGIGEFYVPAGSISDVYCSFYIEHDGWKKWDTLLIASDEPLRVEHATWDIMYINKGREEGIRGGEEFTILRFQQNLRHPITAEPLGEVIRMVGRARVLYVQEHTATVAILDSCEEIEPGFRLKPFEAVTIPLTRKHPWFDPHAQEPTYLARGHVVYLDYDQADVGTHDRLAINVGSEHGILPGDHFMVLREKMDDRLQFDNEVFGGGLRDPEEKGIPYGLAEQIFENAYPRGTGVRKIERRRKFREMREMGIPPRYLGELVVLTTQPETSTAIIVYSIREIMPGDLVELKPPQ
jgi:hypothetical protein